MDNIFINKQSSIKITGSKVLYFDPWDMPFEGDADIIFITHDHFDHFSPVDIELLSKSDTVVVCPQKMARKVNAKNVLAAEPGINYNVKGIDFTAVAAYNIKKHFHPKSDGWCGYRVNLDGISYYITGDTDATDEVTSTKCDMLLLPIGGTYTMDIKQAAECAAKAAPKTVIPTHYGAVVGKPSDGKKFCEVMQKLAPNVNVQLKL